MGLIKCPECKFSCDDQAEMDLHEVTHLRVAAVGATIPIGYALHTCARCGYKTTVELFLEAHKLVHGARIVKFEKLKTHMSLALSESRTQEDSANWEKALDILNEVINSCPDCGGLPCKCGGANGSMQ